MGTPITGVFAKRGLRIGPSHRRGRGRRSQGVFDTYTVALGEVDEWTAEDPQTGQPADDVEWTVTPDDFVVQGFEATVASSSVVAVGQNGNLTANPTTLAFWQPGTY